MKSLKPNSQSKWVIWRLIHPSNRMDRKGCPVDLYCCVVNPLHVMAVKDPLLSLVNIFISLSTSLWKAARLRTWHRAMTSLGYVRDGVTTKLPRSYIVKRKSREVFRHSLCLQVQIGILLRILVLPAALTNYHPLCTLRGIRRVGSA